MLRSLWCAAQMGHFWGPQSPYIWVHFWRNVLRIGSYHRPYNWGPNSVFPAILVTRDTGCICGVMRLPPGDCCNGWLGIEGSIQMGLHGDNFLRHGACLVLSSPLDMGGFWRSAAAHPRQNLVQYPPPPPPPPPPGVLDMASNWLASLFCDWLVKR